MISSDSIRGYTDIMILYLLLRGCLTDMKSQSGSGSKAVVSM